MTLSPQQRTFLVNEQIVGPVVINFGLNALDAWVAFRHFTPIPTWNIPGVAFDLTAVLYGLPFLLTVITTPIVKRAVRKGKVAPLPQGPSAYPILRLLPRHNFWRSLFVAIASVLLLSPPLLFVLWLLGIEQMTVTAYWVLKGCVCGALAGVLAPIATLFAMAQVGEEMRAAGVDEPQTERRDPAPLGELDGRVATSTVIAGR